MRWKIEHWTTTERTEKCTYNLAVGLFPCLPAPRVRRVEGGRVGAGVVVLDCPRLA